MRIKRKVSISCLGGRLGICLLLAFVPQLLLRRKTVYVSFVTVYRYSRNSMNLYSLLWASFWKLCPFFHVSSGALLFPARFSLKESLRLPYQTNPSLLFRGDYSTSGVLRQFPHGMLFGSGGQTSVPGIGRFNNASLGYQHAFNQRLTLQLGVDAMKINMIHSTGQAFSTSGALRYQASDRVAFKVSVRMP